MRCKDPFGKYLVAGATTLVAGQAVVNFGAVLGFLPLTGVPLPLISSGGSSLVVMLNVADTSAAGARAKTPRDEPKEGRATEPKREQQARADRRRRNSGARRAGAGGSRRAAS